MENKDFKQLTEREQSLLIEEMESVLLDAEQSAEQEYQDWEDEQRDSFIEDMTIDLAFEHFRLRYSETFIQDLYDTAMGISDPWIETKI